MYKFQYNNISSARLYIRTFAEQSFISQKLNSTESAFTKLEEALTSIQSNTNFPCESQIRIRYVQCLQI